MHATQVPRPFHTKGWVYEEKYDGWRMLAVKDAGHVRLVSRNGRDHTKRFRDLVAALEAPKPATFTLDGEVAVFDEELVSRFEWLRHLNHGDLATPPLFMAFDLLHLGDKDYRPEPLKVRRRALEKLVRNQKLILPARRLSPNGFARGPRSFIEDGKAWSGKTRSHHVAGRSLRWLKVKMPKYREEERGFYKP